MTDQSDPDELPGKYWRASMNGLARSASLTPLQRQLIASAAAKARWAKARPKHKQLSLWLDPLLMVGIDRVLVHRRTRSAWIAEAVREKLARGRERPFPLALVPRESFTVQLPVDLHQQLLQVIDVSARAKWIEQAIAERLKGARKP